MDLRPYQQEAVEAVIDTSSRCVVKIFLRHRQIPGNRHSRARRKKTTERGGVPVPGSSAAVFHRLCDGFVRKCPYFSVDILEIMLLNFISEFLDVDIWLWQRVRDCYEV